MAERVSGDAVRSTRPSEANEVCDLRGRVRQGRGARQAPVRPETYIEGRTRCATDMVERERS